MFRAFRTKDQYIEWLCDIHDHWVHDSEFTYVVVAPVVIADTAITWLVEEVGQTLGDDVTLGYFECLSKACQFAHCYSATDYDWYNCGDNVPWHDEVKS